MWLSFSFNPPQATVRPLFSATLYREKTYYSVAPKSRADPAASMQHDEDISRKSILTRPIDAQIDNINGM